MNDLMVEMHEMMLNVFKDDMNECMTRNNYHLVKARSISFLKDIFYTKCDIKVRKGYE